MHGSPVRPIKETCLVEGCTTHVQYRMLCRKHCQEIEASDILPLPNLIEGPEELPQHLVREVVPDVLRLPPAPDGRRRWGVRMKYPMKRDYTPPCSGKTELFFDEAGEKTKAKSDRTYKAQWLCGQCELLTACQEWGIAHEAKGIFGGLTPNQRNEIRKERAQAFIDLAFLPMAGFTEEEEAANGTY